MSETGAMLWGVDFTSTPRTRKPIVAACGCLVDGVVAVRAIEHFADWPSFEAFLVRPGPWLAAFDFPFGLPRELVDVLDFPSRWSDLTEHCAALGKAAFKAALDAHRESRPRGARYAHRATDLPARSHSPMKLVNPPVGLMFFEGAPRLRRAGVAVPQMHEGDPSRVAVEAYPGLLARELVSASYKSDDTRKQTPERRAARQTIITRLGQGSHRLALPLRADSDIWHMASEDASGDTLDAMLALVQAAWCWQRRANGFGLPPDFDPVEGWIATAGADEI